MPEVIRDTDILAGLQSCAGELKIRCPVLVFEVKRAATAVDRSILNVHAVDKKSIPACLAGTDHDSILVASSDRC